MGDECNVASRQSDDSSSSSSPILGARIKNLEECHVGDIPHQETDFLLLSKQSGEPDEEIYKITDNKLVENKLPQVEESAVSEPFLFVSPCLGKSTISSFPYHETKLRPDAPPFTPESLARGGIVEITETVCLEANFIPRSMIDDTCFENIELRSRDAELTNVTSSIPESKNQSELEKRGRDFPVIIKEPEMKTINVTSTPKLKEKSSPKESIDSFPVNLQIKESIVVDPESNLDQPGTDEICPETAEPRALRRRWLVLRAACVPSNRTQIVVFIVSLLICTIVVIYVVL